MTGYGTGPYGTDPYGTGSDEAPGEEEEEGDSRAPPPRDQLESRGLFGAGDFGVAPFGGIRPAPPLSRHRFGDRGFGVAPFGGLAWWTQDLYQSVSAAREPARAIDRMAQMLKPPFQDEDHWDELLDLFSDPHDRLQFAAYRTLHSGYVGTATGARLDRIGEFAGVSRNRGEVDARYRVRIIVGMRRQITGATLPEVQEVTAMLLGVDIDRVGIENSDEEPARIDIDLGEDVLEDAPMSAAALISHLNELVAGGVRLTLTIPGLFEHRGEDEFEEDPDDEELGPIRGYNAGAYAGRLST